MSRSGKGERVCRSGKDVRERRLGKGDGGGEKTRKRVKKERSFVMRQNFTGINSS